jgi:hypothetical protein
MGWSIERLSLLDAASPIDDARFAATLTSLA